MKQGRPRSPKTEDGLPAFFLTMGAASGAMKIPMSVLMAAKRDNCDAFVGARVYTQKLRDWLNDNPESIEDSAETIESVKLKHYKVQISIGLERLKREQFDNEVRRRENVPMEEVKLAIAEALSVPIDIARRFMPVETYNVFCREIRSGFTTVIQKLTDVQPDDKSNP